MHHKKHEANSQNFASGSLQKTSQKHDFAQRNSSYAENSGEFERDGGKSADFDENFERSGGNSAEFSGGNSAHGGKFNGENSRQNANSAEFDSENFERSGENSARADKFSGRNSAYAEFNSENFEQNGENLARGEKFSGRNSSHGENSHRNANSAKFNDRNSAYAENSAKFNSENLEQSGENLAKFDSEDFEQSGENFERNSENSPNDELLRCQSELEALKDSYKRANADFENMRKRLEREKDAALKYANEGFARDLLGIVDNLEAALQVEAHDEMSAKLKEGVQNTLDLFLKNLAKHGVTAIAAEGEFDPNLHQAMQHVDSTEPSGTIVQVYQKGYQLNDRVIRPTMVSVAK